MPLISFRSSFDVIENKEFADDVLNDDVMTDALNNNDARNTFNNDNGSEKLVRLIILKFQIIIYEIESL